MPNVHFMVEIWNFETIMGKGVHIVNAVNENFLPFLLHFRRPYPQSSINS